MCVVCYRHQKGAVEVHFRSVMVTSAPEETLELNQFL